MRGRGSVLSLGYGIAVQQMAGGLPSPLYPLYEQWWGLRPSLITVLFVCFVAGVMFSLLVVGPSSDLWGHKRTLLAVTAVSAVAALVYAAAQGPAWIVVANAIQGIAVGAFIAIGPAAMAESLPPGESAVVGRASAFASACGLALGPLWSGLLLQFAPAPGRLVYLIQAGLTVSLAAWLAALPERAQPQARWRLLVAPLRVEPAQRQAFTAAAPAGFLAFSMGGFTVAIVPTMILVLEQVRSGALAGLAVALLFTASAAQSALKTASAEGAVRRGLYAMAAGLLALLLSASRGGLPLLLLGIAVIGAGQGAILKGSLAAIVGGTGERARAGVVSAFFAVCYLGTALPVLAAGGATAAFGLYAAVAGFALAGASLSLLHALLVMPRLLPAEALTGRRPPAARAGG